MAFLSAIYLLFGAVISAVTVAYFRGYGMRPKSYPPGKQPGGAFLLHRILTAKRSSNLANHREFASNANDELTSQTSRVDKAVFVFIRLMFSRYLILTTAALDGPIISLKLGTQDMVVVSSDKIVRDLIDKRSAIYSGRMDVFIREFGDDLNILMREYDP